jgi:Zn ribbon nucleic-acid-binding protein
MKRSVKMRAKCPKCKSENLSITETGDYSTTWEQKNGYVNPEEGIHNPGGVYRVDGECINCGHIWKLKRLQITDLVDKNDNWYP